MLYATEYKWLKISVKFRLFSRRTNVPMNAKIKKLTTCPRARPWRPGPPSFPLVSWLRGTGEKKKKTRTERGI